MRWFRRRFRREQAPEEAAAPSADQPEEKGEDPTPPDEAVTEDEKPAPRRRGTRGGKKRTTTKAEGAEAEAQSEATAPPEKAATSGKAAAATKDTASGKARAKTAAGRKTNGRKANGQKANGQKAGGQSRPRRRVTAPRRAVPSVRKEMLISHDVGEQRVAILEDGTPVEVYLERPGRRSVAGNVYKGVVDTVLPGMEASFVDIGLEKNGFLYVDEIVVPELEGRRHGRRIQDLISRGQEVLVQAVKDPMGTKGARLTTEISLPGRFLVYVPFGDGIGVSRRLEDEERERLKNLCKGFELPEGGIIVRTAAEGATEEELAGDLAFLRKLWSTIQGRAARVQGPALVYREAELPLRVVRDLFTADYERLAIDHERTYRRVVSYLKRTSPDLARKVEWYREEEPLMARFGVDAAVRSTLDRRVDLPSGGYLVFDYAEAFTVIDVNTGRFVGARGKGSSARLEDTITKNNLEAAKEIVRQLRLRDIGGIIVIDFIDMANPKNRAEVEEALKRELERDRTKTYVVEISPLGLVEMTRQNVTDGPREILTTRCTVCDGTGVVISDETYAVDAERALRAVAARTSAEAILVELPSRVAGILIGPSGSRLAEIEKETGKRFAFETRDDLPLDHFKVLAEGTVETIEGRGQPVAVGDIVELELESAHLTEPNDAVARLDGFVVSVAGGGAHVGDAVRARIERVTRTAAYATLADAAEVEAPVEQGALAEAEEIAQEEAARPKRTRRGTRGGRGRKKTADEQGAEQAEEAPGEQAAAEEPAPEPAPGRTRRRKPSAEEEAAGEEAAADEMPPARRSRARKPKTEEQPPPEPAPALEAAAATEEETAAEELPPAEAAEEEKPKKRTRRGTRGGRGRRAKVVADEPGAEELEPVEDASGKEPDAGPEPDETGEPAPSPEDSEEKPRKRTRRGTRGARGRRATAVAGEPGAGASDAAESASDGEPLEAEAELQEAGAAAPSSEGSEGEPAEEAEAEKPRKRTRRGTRGGRGRRAKVGAGEPGSGEPEPEEASGDEAPVGAEVRLQEAGEPASSAEGAEEEKPRKRTRRGTRGGRGRRKATAIGEASPAEVAELASTGG